MRQSVCPINGSSENNAEKTFFSALFAELKSVVDRKKRSFFGTADRLHA
jgi:hypothetical protein